MEFSLEKSTGLGSDLLVKDLLLGLPLFPPLHDWVQGIGGVSPKSADYPTVQEIWRFFAIDLDHLWFDVDPVMVKDECIAIA